MVSGTAVCSLLDLYTYDVLWLSLSPRLSLICICLTLPSSFPWMSYVHAPLGDRGDDVDDSLLRVVAASVRIRVCRSVRSTYPARYCPPIASSLAAVANHVLEILPTPLTRR